jgi:hypothetical protein
MKKVKFFPIFDYIIKHCHEGMLGSGDIAPPFVTSALNGGECSGSRLCRFTAGIDRLVPMGLEPGLAPEYV